MSSSLQEQLIKMGLATEKQAKQASHEQQRQRNNHRHQSPRQQPPPKSAAQLAAERARAEKLARDQEINRKRQAKAERKAKLAEIRQIVEQSKVPRPADGERFNFVEENKIRFLAVDAAQRERIHQGELVIVKYGRSHELVPADVAARIRERDGQSVVTFTAPPPEAVDESDPYKDFKVPDDLRW
jgi:uncharacterized protein YaiL (DUF2058 family)